MIIAGLGDAGVDIYTRVDRVPSFGEKLRAEYIDSFPGGVAANFCAAVAAYGGQARLLGAVGDDAFGQIVRAEAHRLGVDVDHCHVRPGTRTSFTFVSLSPEGEKALTIVPSDNFFPSFDWFEPSALTDVDHLHVAPFDLDRAGPFVTAAREHGATISLDLEPSTLAVERSDLEQLVGQADVVTLNEYGYDMLFGAQPWPQGLAQVRALGPEVAMCTLGPRGVVVADRHATHRVDAVAPTGVRDTTGAGDGFIAVFVTGWLEGRETISAVQQASVAAGLAIGHLGSQSGYPSRAQVAQHAAPAATPLEG